ncbi:hypothetical protein [Oceanobacter mangrovi]|uniref:hypothetical protein n=1 Tax=Oceanobacter mangrovi TaxID=2862510 RepID=UPI001C8DFF5E|nr:hypothetical protein [Oceanobacter mangrovi]
MSFANHIARSAWCLVIASVNRIHVDIWSNGDCEPFNKLLSKQTAFLRGELKSRDNLARFFNEFIDWRATLEADDSLGWLAADLAMAALYASVETLFDEECDDVGLLNQYIDDILGDLIEMQPEMEPLQQYSSELLQEFTASWSSVRQVPVSKDFFQWLGQQDTSLFGVADD